VREPEPDWISVALAGVAPSRRDGVDAAQERLRPDMAGGVAFAALDGTLMLRDLPGVFWAGEMLDWEAPTGGYLLAACFASGRAAGTGVLAFLQRADGVERAIT
jgi:succinate dehydrogenase/fumarate reductase flavoprotein subunit